jgi:ribosomal protein S18 acetylase RimI-like enzyme
MVIRYAQKNELHLIRKIAFETWPVAYGNILSDDQLAYMLKMMYDLDVLTSQQEQLNHHFILAFDEFGNEMGFASYSKDIDDLTSKYLLHKLYILPNQQGKKIGTMLLDFVINEIKKREEISAIQLNVNRYNNALNFYLKHGFSIRHEEDNDIGAGYFMNDYVMQKEL